jgi:DNA polymerase (family 10)
MAKETEIPLEKAKFIADKFIELVLKDITERVEICGSIRRKKQIVHDIDIVCIPDPSFITFAGHLLRKLPRPSKIIKTGDKLLEVEFSGEDFEKIQIDIYVANEQTFEIIKLIRTGSREHNVKLCSLAKQKEMKLHADGRGLFTADDKVLIANTEEGILIKLLGKWIPPEERD